MEIFERGGIERDTDHRFLKWTSENYISRNIVAPHLKCTLLSSSIASHIFQHEKTLLNKQIFISWFLHVLYPLTMKLDESRQPLLIQLHL